MVFVKVKEIKELKRGDIIRNLYNNSTYVISATYGEYAIAVDSIHVSNPHEWVVLKQKQE